MEDQNTEIKEIETKEMGILLLQLRKNFSIEIFYLLFTFSLDLINRIFTYYMIMIMTKNSNFSYPIKG